MKTTNKLSLSLALISASFAFSTSANAEQKHHVIFVHGAHFDASSWAAVIKNLPDHVDSSAINLPGRDSTVDAKSITLDSSSQALCDYAAKLEQPYHFVAHSQGGAIVNQALDFCQANLPESITYVTALAPNHGTTPFEILSKKDGDSYMSAGLHYNKEGYRMEVVDTDKFADVFAQDAVKQQRRWLEENGLDEPALIGEGKISTNDELIQSIDKYYVFANKDKIVSLASQLKIANQWNVKDVFSVQSGHLPMLTQPKKLAEIITEITEQH